MLPGFLEFFAGIGLVHLGLKVSGWHCVYANDISVKKKEMYLHEMPEAETYFHCEDIWKTDSIIERIKEQALLATASFPCIDLSLAGHMKGMNGEHSSSFYGFIKVMKQLKDEGRMPSFLLLENVTGLLTSNEGKDFKDVCTTISKLGFFIDAFVIDAKHFTPQSRPRLFIVGMLEEVLPPDVARGSQNGWRSRLLNRATLNPPRLMTALQNVELPTGWIAFNLPLLPPEQRTLASLIDLNDEQEWWGVEAVYKHLDMMTDLHRQRVEKMKHSGGLWIGTIFRRIRNGKTRAETRFDGLAGCLRTAKGGSAKQIVIVVDQGAVKMRWMSPVEYARLQGVPDYNIRVSRNQALTGFADAVCVPVIEWINKHVFLPASVNLGYEMLLQEPSAPIPAELSVICSR